MRQRWIGLAVFLIGLACTALATLGLRAAVADRDRERLAHSVEQTHNAVRTRMEAYVALLRGGAGFFAASEHVNPDEFRAFVERLDLPRSYPGVQGVGYSARVPAADRDPLEAGMGGAFRVWPAEPERDEYHAILHLEPRDERNLAAIGYDMFSEPVRREAMERARDTGLPAMSGPVHLVQEITGRTQPGFLVYVPVYVGDEQPGTVEARRERLRGFVYSPFRAGDLFNGIFDGTANPRVGFSVVDGPADGGGERLYRYGAIDERASKMPSPVGLEFAGRAWTITYWPLPAFDFASGRRLVPLVFAGGVGVSALLALIAWREARARAQAERAMAEAADAREHLSTTLASIGDAVLTTDADGRLTFLNPAAEALTGWTAREAAGRAAAEVVRVLDETSREPGPDPFRWALGRSEAPAEPDRALLVRRDGSETPIESSAAPIRTADGRSAGAVLVFRDVSMNRRTDETIRTQARVLESMAEGVSLADEAGRLIYTNAAEDRMFGYEAGELLGRHVTELNDLPPEENARVVGEVIEQLKTEGQWQGEWRNRRKDGTPFWTRSKITAIQLHGRRCWVCVHEDITDRKQAEERAREEAAANARVYAALRSREGQLSIITNAIPMLISYVDADERYQFVNREYESWFGRPAEDIRGRPVREVIGDAAYAQVRDHVRRALRGEQVRYEARMTYRDAGVREVVCVYLPQVAPDGFVEGFVAVVTDVTERKRAEDRHALLADASVELAATLDYEATLTAVARMTVPRFADWSVVDVLDEGGGLRHLAVEHADPEKVSLVRGLQERYPPRPDAPRGVLQVLRTGRPDLAHDISDAVLAAYAHDEEHLQTLRSLGLRSSMSVPLIARGRTLGVLTFVSAESGRRYTEDDLSLAAELGRRAGIAIDNALLLRARAQSEERYKALVTASAQTVWTWQGGEEGGPTDRPVRWHRLSGGSDELGWLEAVHPDDRARTRAAWERCIREGTPYEVEYKAQARGGTARHLRARAVPVPGPEDSSREWVGTLADITEQKQAETAAQESEARFRLMADSAPVLIWLAATDKSYYWFNRTWLGFTGRTPEEEAGSGWTENVHPDDAGRRAEVYAASFDARRDFETTYRLRRHDGEYRWLLDHGVPLFSSDGTFTGYIGSCIDITEIEHARETLERHSHQLERLVEERTAALDASRDRLRHAERMASLGTLAAGIGHDLGNLLLPVRVRLGLLSERCPPGSGEDLQAIEKSIEYLGQLAQGLRLLARDPFETPRQDDATDVHAWWASIRGLMRNPLPRGVTLKERIPPGLPRVRIGDTALTQAVFNLIQNAGDALTPREAGTVTVWAEADPDRARVHIGVADDGPGMTPEARARCLEPFFTTKARGISTGMGLSLVSAAIQRVGGTVSVESTPGQGAVFILSVPAAENAPPTDAPPPEAVVATRRERMGAYARTVLEQLGFQVRRAGPEEPAEGLLWVLDAPSDPGRLRAFLDADPRRAAVVIGPAPADAGPRVFPVPEVFRPASMRETLGVVARQVRSR